MISLFSSSASNAQPVAGKGATAGAAGDLVKEGSDRTFMADVIDASRTVPVIVDFWATWCGPCKQLGPLLEKYVRAAKGAVRMVKIDTDRNPAVAGQLRVQSIPAVYAFFQGRPVDGFVGAQREPQIKQFVERLVQLAAQAGGGMAGDAEGMLEGLLNHAREAIDQGDTGTAAAIYNEILSADPANAAAYAGVIRCHVVRRDFKRARQMLEKAPAELAQDKELKAVRATLDLVEECQGTRSVRDLEAQVKADPADHAARYDLAMALFAAGNRDGAVDQLLELVRRDREWEEQKARKLLLRLFEALGTTDKLTVSGRRRLSSLLFS